MAQQLNKLDLSEDVVRAVREKVASGAYRSESDVVVAGLRALQDREDETERWLHETVGPTYDAHRREPEAAEPIGSVMARLRARMDRVVDEN
ncbi:type II toxin-antitoxin system ParD family antitoxin [Methyloraptor flagellatus]|jgi:putative addiction module CopG family antidote|uniref:Type II toxin-antitoxin system ParD family antitoxin n=1 Tax=Methyloraptor flagellatus TaxID=3162530 RepID=A0AAU7X5H6_9HYPH